jgi:hypothetical protein
VSKKKHKNEPENQHFVNQEYLRNFATPESIAQHRSNREKWHVRVYDKTLKRVLPSRPIRSVAAKRFFYDLPGEPASISLEKPFGSLEGASAAVHRKLLKTRDYTKLSASEKETFAKFIAIQYVRTDHQRLLAKWVTDEQLVPRLLDPVQGIEYVEQLERKDISKRHEQIARLEYEIKLAYLRPIPMWERNEAIAELTKQIDALNSQNRSTRNEFDPANLEEIRRKMAEMMQQDDPDHRREVHKYQIMVLAPAVGRHIQSRVWQINENKTSKHLCTSDHPVLTIPIAAPQHRDPYHALLTLGLPDMGDAIGLGEASDKYPPFRLAFPLSPKLVISLYPYGSDIDPYRELPEKEIEILNMLQAIQSSRQIYSRDTDFAFVDNARAYYNRVRAYIENLTPTHLPNTF